ncbi:hypothetical protein RQP46_003833 [Phenoliferia psychrophenolica]
MSDSTEPCAVCPAPGRLHCSRCKQVRFCSTEHQTLIWSSHKHLCKPNEPLVFRQRAVRPDELRQHTAHCAGWLIANGVVNDKYKNLSEAELAARMMASKTTFFASPEVDPVTKSDTISDILAWILSHSDHAEHDAFSYTGYILVAEFEVPATHNHPARVEQSALGLLDAPTRQKAELQALVLGTLLEKDAPRELIVLAVERLVAIVGDAGGVGRTKLFDSTMEAVLTAASRRMSVDILDFEALQKLEGAQSIEALEEVKRFMALSHSATITPQLAMSNSTEPCAVCPAPGRLQCSRCKQIRFCSTEHQALIWSSHKLLCKPGEPLVFLQRAVHPDEIQQYATKGAQEWLASGELEGTDISEEELVAQLVASNTLLLASPEDDAVHKTNIINIILAWSIFCTDHADHDAFSYAGYMLSFSREIPATHDHPARFEQSALEHLAVLTRQKAELQVLVLATLLEKNAPRDLTVLAVERLVAIMGNGDDPGRQQLIKNLRKAILLAAWRRSSASVKEGVKDVEALTKLKDVKKLKEAREELKAYQALRKILDGILGPDEE